jgi:two-component system sensor histidine kinase YesM
MHKNLKLSIAQYIIISTIAIVLIFVIVTSVFYNQKFTQTTTSLVDFQSEEISKQIVLNYENYIDQTMFTSNYIQQETSLKDITLDHTYLEELFELTTNSQSDISSIQLLDSNGVVKLSSTKTAIIRNFANEQWFLEALNNKDIFFFSAPHKQNMIQDDQTNVISVSKAIEYLDNNEEKTGVIVIDINSSIIIELSEITNLGQNGHILILNDQNEIIHSSNNYCIDSSCESIRIVNEYVLGDFQTTIDNVDMKVTIDTLNHTRWKIITFMNIEEVTSANKNITIFLFVLSASSIFVTSIIALILADRIRKPLNQLKRYMKEVEQGNFDEKIAIYGQIEIEEIANSFTEMVSKIRVLMDAVVEEKNQKLKNELTALQHQINPHFLYNTLDSIVWLAENNRNEDVIKTVVALARFFRISISKGKNVITVKEEIQHIKNYLVIQQVRYTDRFTYHFDIDESLYSYPCMKLILQPIVENAIYHGVSIEDGEINIKCFKTDSSLVFEVSNSGYGITPEEIEEIYNTIKDQNVNKGVGMRNVYQRLKLYYGDNADIEIESILDEQTTIRLILPLIEVKE